MQSNVFRLSMFIVLYVPTSFPSVSYTSFKDCKSLFGFVYIVTQGYSGFFLVESVWNNLGTWKWLYLELSGLHGQNT